MNWFQIILNDDKRLNEAIEYYTKEYEEARKETNVRTYKKMADAISAISSNFEHRLDQYSDLESIYQFFDAKLRKIRGRITQEILTKSARAVNSTDMKAFIDANDVVSDITEKLILIDSVRKKYEGLSKAFDVLNWQLSNLVKLQIAGLDGALIPV